MYSMDDTNMMILSENIINLWMNCSLHGAFLVFMTI